MNNKEHFRVKEQRELGKVFLPTILKQIENGERDKDLEELLLDDCEEVRVVARERLGRLNRI